MLCYFFCAFLFILVVNYLASLFALIVPFFHVNITSTQGLKVDEKQDASSYAKLKLEVKSFSNDSMGTLEPIVLLMK